MAFLDGEEQVTAPEEPERRERRIGGPERRRQQYLVRRLIAVGAGVAFLILLVIGFRGCLEARSDRGLSNYAQDIGTIMAESEQRGKDFFETIEDTSGSPLDTKNKVASLRGASEQLLTRAERIDTPGQMRDAQSAATLSLRLRRDALDAITASTAAAAADEETDNAIESITNAMGSIYASDILWSQVSVPEIEKVLQDESVSAPDLPPGTFMPENSGTEFLDQNKIAELFSGVSGSDTTSGDHGLGLVQTQLGETTLDPSTTTSVPDDATDVAVEVQNQGSEEESDVAVTVTVDGTDLETTIGSIGAGETGTAKVTINPLPQPGSEVTIDVVVAPVSGEQITENNQSSYSVIFGSSP